MKKYVCVLVSLLLLANIGMATGSNALNIKRVNTHNGVKLAKPRIYGVVPTSSSVAVTFNSVWMATSYLARVYELSGSTVIGVSPSRLLMSARTNQSNTLTVSGLSSLTNYRVTVQAIGNGQNWANSDESYSFAFKTLISQCANGGACSLGDTGPGGGKVFYVSSGFTESGAPCNTSCHYLEVAPRTGPNAWVESTYQWSHASYGGVNTGTALGAGYLNTVFMVMFDMTSGYAGTASALYRGPNNKTDWFLPSIDELSLLFANRDYSEPLANVEYWSSSQVGPDLTSLRNLAWTGHTDFWGTLDSETLDYYSYVLPIRAF